MADAPLGEEELQDVVAREESRRDELDDQAGLLGHERALVGGRVRVNHHVDGAREHGEQRLERVPRAAPFGVGREVEEEVHPGAQRVAARCSLLPAALQPPAAQPS